MSGYGKHYRDTRNLKNMSDLQFEKVQILCRNTATATSANGIKELDFYLPKKGYLMGVRSGFEMLTNITGGNMDCLSDAFTRVEVWFGNKKVLDEKNFNHFRRIEMAPYIKGDQKNSVSLKRLGYLQGSSQSDSTDYVKFMPLAHPVFWSRGLFSEILPLKDLPQVMIRLTICESIDEFTGGDASAFSFSDLKLHLHLLDSKTLRAKYGSGLKRAIQTHYYSKYQESSATSVDHRLSGNYTNAKSVLCIQKLNADVNTGVTGNGHNFVDNFVLNSADEYYLEIDGQKIGNGSKSIRTTSNQQLIIQLEECWKPKDFILGDYYDDTSDESKLYLGVNLCSENRALSGKNLASTTGTINFKIDSISVSALTDFNYYVVYDRFLVIDGAGNVKVAN